MNDVFYWCVRFLEKWAAIFGITYEEINVILFCILWPVISIVMVAVIARLYLRNRKLSKLIKSQQRLSA